MLVSTWEPWAFVGDVPAVFARVERAAHDVGAARALGVVGVERRRRAPLARTSCPACAASAGRANRWKVTIADTGLPGRPKTSTGPASVRTFRTTWASPAAARRPRRPPRRRAPRAPAARGRGARPTRRRSRPRRPPPAPARARPRSPRGRRRPSPPATTSAPAARDLGRASRSRSCSGSGPGRAGRAGSTSSSPVTTTATRGRRAQAQLRHAGRRRDPELGRAEARARGEHASRPRGCPRRRGGSPCRRERGGDPQLAVACSASSTRSTASAPAGTIAPVEMPIASPGPSVPSYGRAGARLADQPQLRRASPGVAAGGVGGAQREPVHRRVVEARHVVCARRRPRPARGRARLSARRSRARGRGARSSTAATAARGSSSGQCVPRYCRAGRARLRPAPSA